MVSLSTLLYVLTFSLSVDVALGSDAASFVSNDGLYCAEGPTRKAESALALKKAAPYGSIFDSAFVVPGSTCVGQGFVFYGPDACTPDVTVHFKTASDAPKFEASYQAALLSYSGAYNISKENATLMSNCTCHPGSPTLAAAGDQCTSLDTVTGCWVHENPYNGSQMMCDQGPFVYAMRALSVLKSSPQLPMHFHDQIRATSCSNLGFGVIFDYPDHCYPKLRVWTRVRIDKDPGVQESMWVENNLTTGGFDEFAAAHHFGDLSVLNNSLACNCFANSSVGQSMKGLCPALTNHSPVRDWWPGNEGDHVAWV